MDFFEFILFETCSASWTYRFISFSIFVSFLAIIPWNDISVPLSLSSPFGSLMIQMFSFVIVPEVPEALFNFFPIYSL